MNRRTGRIAAALCSVALLLDPALAAAQQARLVEPGAYVRISSPAYIGEGTTMKTTSDTLRIRVEGRSNPVAVPFLSLERLERRRPATFGERALRGAKWGAAIGAGVGAMGIVMSERGPNDPPQATWPVVGAVYFGASGALISLLIPQHRWERVPPRGRLSLSWGEGAVQASVAFSL